jgi:hypothetical protein
MSERAAEPEGIAGFIRCEKPVSGTNMAQRRREKSSESRDFGAFSPELQAETGL